MLAHGYGPGGRNTREAEGGGDA